MNETKSEWYPEFGNTRRLFYESTQIQREEFQAPFYYLIKFASPWNFSFRKPLQSLIQDEKIGQTCFSRKNLPGKVAYLIVKNA